MRLHIEGSDATLNRSTGRSHAIGTGLAKRTFITVPAGSDRAAAHGEERDRTAAPQSTRRLLT